MERGYNPLDKQPKHSLTASNLGIKAASIAACAVEYQPFLHLYFCYLTVKVYLL
jgi:hypothetical protein